MPVSGMIGHLDANSRARKRIRLGDAERAGYGKLIITINRNPQYQRQKIVIGEVERHGTVVLGTRLMCRRFQNRLWQR